MRCESGGCYRRSLVDEQHEPGEKKRDLGTNLLSPRRRAVAPPSLYCCKSSELKQIGIGLNVFFRLWAFLQKCIFWKSIFHNHIFRSVSFKSVGVGEIAYSRSRYIILQKEAGLAGHLAAPVVRPRPHFPRISSEKTTRSQSLQKQLENCLWISSMKLPCNMF